MNGLVEGLQRVLLVAAVALLPGCSNEGDEVSRKSSPDKQADAVVLESSQGATTSYTYQVCVVAAGSKCSDDWVVAVLYDATRSRSSYGVNLVWLNEKKLQIQYFRAGSAALQPKLIDKSGRVDVSFLSGVIDENAKPGAMFRTGKDAVRLKQ